MPDDGAVVDQEEVRNAAETFEGFVLISADRLVAKVAAGGDNGEPERQHEQVMQRGVGEHYAEVGVGRSEGRRKCGMRTAERGMLAAEEDDGGFGGTQEALFERRYVAGCLDGRERWEHQGEGLFLAVLQFPQAPDRLVKVRRDH